QGKHGLRIEIAAKSLSALVGREQTLKEVAYNGVSLRAGNRRDVAAKWSRRRWRGRLRQQRQRAAGSGQKSWQRFTAPVAKAKLEQQRVVMREFACGGDIGVVGLRGWQRANPILNDPDASFVHDARADVRHATGTFGVNAVKERRTKWIARRN